MEIQYKNLKIFGPAVLKVKIPDEITKQLNDYINVHDPMQGKKVESAGIRNTEIGKNIRDAFEEYDVDILPDKKIKNGYDPARHKNIEKLIDTYDAMRQEEAGFTEIPMTDIRTKGLSAAELDNLNNTLGLIKAGENGKQLKDVSMLELQSHFGKEIGENIKGQYVNLIRGLRDLGLNIQETSNQDGSPKFIVKKIEGRNAEDIGVFQQYNDII